MLSCFHFKTPLGIKDQPKLRDNKHNSPTEYEQLVRALKYLNFNILEIVQAMNKVCNFKWFL